MQPCSTSVAAAGMIAPTPDYISYTAQLLLRSSALLAQVGSSTGMDRSRRTLPCPSAQYQVPLEDPPTSRRANVQAHDPRYRSIPAVVEPHSSPESDSGTGRKRPCNLRSLIGRRQDENSSVPLASSPPLSSQQRSEYARSAPPMQVSYPRSIAGPISMPLSTSHHQHRRERQPAPLAVPPSTNTSRQTTSIPPWSSAGSPAGPQSSDPTTSWDQSYPSSRSTDNAPTPLRVARTYPGVPWDDSPNRRHRRRQSTTFDDPRELHQFAEATSGFDPFSPVRPRPVTVYSEYYAPRVASTSPPASADMARSSSQAIAEALAALGAEDGDLVPPPGDEELPDYATSQWEAQSHARRAAARRAAELERQWVEARQRGASS